MYQNMTREEMIQRLYEGNFTTGELERQLIAKLFEQCCGGGSGSSGGGAFVVNKNYDETDTVITLDKTAAEIFEAVKNGLVIVGDTLIEGDQGRLGRTEFIINVRKYGQQYMFVTIEITSSDDHPVLDYHSYYAVNDNDYPTNQAPSEDDDNPPVYHD